MVLVIMTIDIKNLCAPDKNGEAHRFFLVLLAIYYSLTLCRMVESPIRATTAAASARVIWEAG